MDTKGYLNMELLRFTTAGSVDDGKSTLIGRLLYDSKSIFQDQLESIANASSREGNESINLALLTDGLRAEREQGITIDVAYRYFATPKRKFIIADTPGHIQYTRNMVTGASTADLAVILIDARHGVLEQTIRHSYIASLLRIPNIVVCINKMDLVNYSEEIFNQIIKAYDSMSTKLDINHVTFIPISAKYGDNVVEKSDKMKWYMGGPLMETLETTPISHKINSSEFRFPVQYVIRPISDTFPDFRGYAGRIAGGLIKTGDKVIIWPSGKESEIKDITLYKDKVDLVFAPQSVSLQIKDDYDIGRGDMICKSQDLQPYVSKKMTMMICWLSENKMAEGNKYLVKTSVRESVGTIKKINFKVDINNLKRTENINELSMNDIASVTIETESALIFDSYSRNKITGSLIFIDRNSFETVGAGMIEKQE